MKRLAAACGSIAMTMMLVACGGDDRPPVAEYVAGDAVAALLVPPPRRKDVQVCSPGASRSCLVGYVENGRKSCYWASQYCRANGSGWLACGEPAEAPLPPEEDAEPNEDEEGEEPYLR